MFDVVDMQVLKEARKSENSTVGNFSAFGRLQIFCEILPHSRVYHFEWISDLEPKSETRHTIMTVTFVVTHQRRSLLEVTSELQYVYPERSFP